MSKVLCLDCGNSRLKWGLREGDGWRATGALRYEEMARLPEALSAASAGATIDKAIGCNVAGADRAAQIATALSLPIQWVAAQAAQCGVVNGYETPASLGADRWAALIGARAMQRGTALVVMAGTATTIDVLDAEGRFRGGLILPGLTLMATALADGTARLPLARGEFKPLPRNTHDAIASGALQATLGAIERMFAALSPQQQDTVCLLAGGAAEFLESRLAVPCRRIDTLVLEGLACIAAGQGADPA